MPEFPVTFKAGGTSLCGQTITDSVLVETGRDLPDGLSVKMADSATFQPGITGEAPMQFLPGTTGKLVPSPASIASAKIGGIIANNASGASYGIATNSYNTLRGLRLVFADGSVLDTRDPDSRELFQKDHPALMEGICSFQRRWSGNAAT